MPTQDKITRLRETWLFSGCSERELRRIAKAFDEVDVPVGRVLCEAGTVGREFFIILSGMASVQRNGKKVANLVAGDYFGELALLDRRPRSATVVSASVMDLLVLDQRRFNGLLDAIPALSRKLLAATATRLRQADAKAFN
ncbi:MAG: cyclic nucleotide-binding domain-containing protein [Actinomycetes bacterium]